MEINLSKIWQFVRPRSWLVALCAVLGAIGCFIYSSFFVTPMYVSTAKMYVYNNDRQNMQISAADLSASQQLINTYIEIIKGNTVMQEVAQKINLGYSASQIKAMFSASAVNETEIFKISIRYSNPEHAQRIVNAIIEIAPEYIKTTVKAGSVEIIDAASLPKSPSYPNVATDTIKGFLAGAVLSLGVLVAINFLDRRIHSDDDITESYNIPLLGIIPEIQSTQVSKEVAKR